MVDTLTEDRNDQIGHNPLASFTFDLIFGNWSKTSVSDIFNTSSHSGNALAMLEVVVGYMPNIIRRAKRNQEPQCGLLRILRTT